MLGQGSDWWTGSRPDGEGHHTTGFDQAAAWEIG